MLVQRKKKRNKRRRRLEFRTIDMRPHISSLQASIPQGWEERRGWSGFQASLCRINERGMRPTELLTLLGINAEQSRVIRLKTKFKHLEMV